MNKIKAILTVALLCSSAFASANPGVFFGVVYAFGAGGGPGVSLKVLSSNKEDRAVVGAGASFYPLAPTNRFGVDADVGYLSKDFAATVGWDFLQQGVLVGVGYVKTKNDSARPVVLTVGCGPGTDNSTCTPG